MCFSRSSSPEGTDASLTGLHVAVKPLTETQTPPPGPLPAHPRTTHGRARGSPRSHLRAQAPRPGARGTGIPGLIPADWERSGRCFPLAAAHGPCGPRRRGGPDAPGPAGLPQLRSSVTPWYKEQAGHPPTVGCSGQPLMLKQQQEEPRSVFEGEFYWKQWWGGEFEGYKWFLEIQG